MHLITAIFGLLASTTVAWSPFAPLKPNQIIGSRLEQPKTCNTAALAAFIPSGVPPPAQPFTFYLQQPVCRAPPTFTGLVPRNRFQEDYERFAKYFNENYTHVPHVCQKRFEKVTTLRRVPGSYDEYIREERKQCGEKKEDKDQDYGHGHDGEGHKKHESSAMSSYECAMLPYAYGAVMGAAMAML